VGHYRVNNGRPGHTNGTDGDDDDGTTESVVCHFKNCSVRLGFINMFAN